MSHTAWRSTTAQCTLAEHVTRIFASRFRPLVILDQLACCVLQEIALRRLTLLLEHALRLDCGQLCGFGRKF
jgi:hypothetical protein